MEPSSQSDNTARATHEIADGILMSDFVEREIIRKESLRPATRESGATPTSSILPFYGSGVGTHRPE